MHPFLFDFTLGSIHIRIPSYGVFLALAFSVAYFEAIRRAIKQNDDPKHVENLFLYVVLSSIVGSRLFHVFFEEFSYYWAHPLKVFAVWEGGYTLYGALLACLVAIFTYCHKKKLNPLHFFDIATPSTALGIGIGRIGCFLAGCCWGKPCDLPWGVQFTHPETFSGLRAVTVHPTQLYESFAAFAIAAYVLWLYPRKKYEGQILFQGLIGYGIVRFFIEYFRGDEYRGYIIQDVLSYSQLVSVALIAAAAYGIHHFGKATRKHRKKRK